MQQSHLCTDFTKEIYLRKRNKMNTMLSYSLKMSAGLSKPLMFYFNFVLQKTTKLKQMLNSPDLEFIMEAHNGMCARIVQEAGNIAVSRRFGTTVISVPCHFGP